VSRRLAVIAAIVCVVAVGAYLVTRGGSDGRPAKFHGPVPGATTTGTPSPADNFALQQVRAVRKLHCIQRAGGNARRHARCERLP
jgi:hypothetical protein